MDSIEEEDYRLELHEALGTRPPIDYDDDNYSDNFNSSETTLSRSPFLSSLETQILESAELNEDAKKLQLHYDEVQQQLQDELKLIRENIRKIRPESSSVRTCQDFRSSSPATVYGIEHQRILESATQMLLTSTDEYCNKLSYFSISSSCSSSAFYNAEDDVKALMLQVDYDRYTAAIELLIFKLEISMWNHSHKRIVFVQTPRHTNTEGTSVLSLIGKVSAQKAVYERLLMLLPYIGDEVDTNDDTNDEQSHELRSTVAVLLHTQPNISEGVADASIVIMTDLPREENHIEVVVNNGAIINEAMLSNSDDENVVLEEEVDRITRFEFNSNVNFRYVYDEIARGDNWLHIKFIVFGVGENNMRPVLVKKNGEFKRSPGLVMGCIEGETGEKPYERKPWDELLSSLKQQYKLDFLEWGDSKMKLQILEKARERKATVVAARKSRLPLPCSETPAGEESHRTLPGLIMGTLLTQPANDVIALSHQIDHSDRGKKIIFRQICRPRQHLQNNHH